MMASGITVKFQLVLSVEFKTEDERVVLPSLMAYGL